jgi:undecaprenyl diphosphate synthase
MDGNRRFAKAQGMMPWEGHALGKEKLVEVLRWAKDVGIEHLICYAFSTENWSRPEEEIKAIRSILITALTGDLRQFIDEGVALRFVGERERFDAKLRALMDEAEEKTKEGAQTLSIALSYGGRAEIVAAASKAAQGGEITEATLANNLWTAGIPDPELIIRTGGQRRLSNFLLWQSAYTELYFTDVFWPAFSRNDFDAALNFYQSTKRNFGK